jgi:hypothetical protein
MTDTFALDDPYYRISVTVVGQGAGTFRAIGRIKRVDTQETVGGTVSFGSEEQATKAECLAALVGKLPGLPRPPHEWGLLERRGVVQAYLRFNEGLTRLSLDLQRARASGTLSEELLHEKLVAMVDHVSRQMISLGRRVDALSESDRAALALIPPASADVEVGPLGSDEIDARLAIRDLFMRADIDRDPGTPG